MKRRNVFFTSLCLVTLSILLFCSVPAFASDNSSNSGKSTLKEAREDLEQKLADAPGFAGIAHSEAKGEIIVFLEHGQAKNNLPDSYRGFAVKKEITGPFKALETQVLVAPDLKIMDQLTYDRHGIVRPLVGGISISALAGKRYIYAGTLGMVTYNNKILSNAHVLAMNPDNNSWLPTGTTSIVQPGTLDGGRTTANIVGSLENYISITFGKTKPQVKNYADAAIASIKSGIVANSGDQLNATDSAFYNISGTTLVNQGDTVNKSGRTTGWSTNTVNQINADVWIDYGGGKKAFFTDQILVNEPFIESGDSGSAVSTVINGQEKFVGLAFAGSSSYAIINKASYIIDGLAISVGP